jgi:hypothetical protein
MLVALAAGTWKLVPGEDPFRLKSGELDFEITFRRPNGRQFGDRIGRNLIPALTRRRRSTVWLLARFQEDWPMWSHNSGLPGVVRGDHHAVIREGVERSYQ